MDFEDDDLWTVGFSNGESNVFRVIECLFKRYKMQVGNENSFIFHPVTIFLAVYPSTDPRVNIGQSNKVYLRKGTAFETTNISLSKNNNILEHI